MIKKFLVLGFLLRKGLCKVMAVTADLVTLIPVMVYMIKGLVMIGYILGLSPLMMVVCGCSLRVSIPIHFIHRP